MTEFAFHTPENTSGSTRELLEGLRRSYGFFPNLFGYMAEAPATIEGYLALNDLLAKTSLSPAQQQVAMLAVSVENDCEFCRVAHHAIGKMKGANAQSLDALNACALGACQEIADEKDRALANFTRTIVKTRGRPSEADIRSFLDAGFSKRQILEVILIVSIKTLSNYINHLTRPEPNRELLG